MLAARVARRSRGASFSSKRVIRHASTFHDLGARSFASSDQGDIERSERGDLYVASSRAFYWNDASAARWSHSLAKENRFARLSAVDSTFSSSAPPMESASSLPFLLDQKRLAKSVSLRSLSTMPAASSDDYIMTPRAMKRLIYTSTVRALGTQSTPFEQALHRVVQRAYFSAQPEPPREEISNSSSGTSSPASSGAKVPTPSSASFSTSTSPSSEENKPSYAKQAQDAIISASKSLANFFIKLPGVLWFYLTHPSELKTRLQELKEAAKHEVNHYYMGSKLLVADVKTAWSMLKRTLQGSALSRRERKQLLRTVSDLFRLVPFSMFVLIPFMEFALPFALRLFPNMLPSTFQDSLKAEESMKRELKSRIAMAAFFQE